MLSERHRSSTRGPLAVEGTPKRVSHTAGLVRQSGMRRRGGAPLDSAASPTVHYVEAPPSTGRFTPVTMPA